MSAVTYLNMGRHRVENAFGMLIYIWINAASSAVFALSRVSVRDLEQVLSSPDAANVGRNEKRRQQSLAALSVVAAYMFG